MQPVEIPEPVLGPQIEWMLLSHQVSQDELIEALIRDHYLAVYKHVLQYSDDPHAANRSARLTIVRAVERAHTYRVGQGVENWIKDLGAEVHYRHLRLRRLKALLRPFSLSSGSTGSNPQLRKFQDNAAELDETQVQFLVGAVTSELRSVETRRKIVRSFLLTAFAGVALLLFVILNLSDRSLTPDPGSSPTGLNATFSSQQENSSSRSTRSASAVQLENIAPLTAESSITEIVQRIRESSQTWSSLWADGLIIDYGPEGYRGPAIIQREQLWLEPPSRSRILSGSLTEGRIEKIWVASVGQAVKEAVDDLGWKHYTGGGLIEYTAFRALLRPAFAYYPEGRTVVLGEEVVAGRDALIVDYFLRSGRHEGRYSIDARTGIALRLRRYTGNSLEWVREERVFTEVRFNYDMTASTSLFEPSYQRPVTYASAPSGLPETAQSRVINVHGAGIGRRMPLPQIVPPPDLDPAHYDLTYQFTEITRLGASSDAAEIYAGPYYLGKVVMDDPWRLQCSRSPDGRRIAFYAGAARYDEDATRIRWIALDDLSQMHSPISHVIPASNLAFSPDGERLALAGCNSAPQACGLYLLNLESDSADRLIDLQGATSLVWSPDGQQIAFLGGRDGDPEWRIYVVDAKTGEIVYRGSVLWEASSIRAASGAPVSSWDVRFPVSTRGLSDCLSAPEASH